MARLLNGSSDYLSSATTPVTDYPLTLAAWGRPHNVTVNMTAIAVEDGSIGKPFVRLQLFGAGGDTLRAQVHSTTSQAQSATTDTYSANTWHHFGGVFPSTTSRTAYLDGVAGAEDTTNISITNIDNINVGRLQFDGTPIQHFDGDLAEVAIWDVALSGAEMASLAQGISPKYIRPQSLVAYWPLYGLSSPEVDFSGGDYGLTVTGATASDHAPISLSTRRSNLMGEVIVAGTVLPIFIHHYKQQGFM